jgi:hypothetical protein
MSLFNSFDPKDPLWSFRASWDPMYTFPHKSEENFELSTSSLCMHIEETSPSGV